MRPDRYYFSGKLKGIKILSWLIMSVDVYCLYFSNVEASCFILYNKWRGKLNKTIVKLLVRQLWETCNLFLSLLQKDQ